MATAGRVRKVVGGAVVLAALGLAPLAGGSAGAAPGPCTPEVLAEGGGRLPDIQTVVPQHLNLVNEHQREVLRFSNLIANTGAGPWRLRPEFPLADSPPGTTQKAIQQILDSEHSRGNVVCEELVSEFTYHPTHKHWHTTGVALFEIRSESPTGPVFVNDAGALNSIKTTFCLIDWVKLAGSSNSGKNTTRTYFDCAGAFHGVSVGWADQYHHATDDQDLDITGVVDGETYFLVSVTNSGSDFLESDYGNNSAWQAFTVNRDSKGNPKIVLGARSPCALGTGLCGEQTANR
jgi:hypothetical protein